jgi:hypothetical protein
MPQNNQLHAYSRLDGSGRIIPSTTVLRKKKPVTGKWVENLAYQCCNNQLLTNLLTTPADVTLTAVTFTLFCTGVTVANLSVTSVTSSLATLAAVAQSNFSVYGDFTVVGSQIQLALRKEIGDSLCPDGVLSFTLS